jgi:hypothetical protein
MTGRNWNKAPIPPTAEIYLASVKEKLWNVHVAR